MKKLFSLSAIFVVMVIGIAISVSLNHDSSSKKVTIDAGQGIDELTLVSMQNTTVGYDSIYKFRSSVSKTLDAAKYKFLTKFVKGNDAVITLFIQKDEEVDRLAVETVFHGYYSYLTENLTNITVRNYTTVYTPYKQNVSVWVPINSLDNINIISNTDYFFNVRGVRKLTLGEQRLDVTPKISGVELSDYFAWWNTSFAGKQNQTVENRVGVTIARAFVNVTRNDTAQGVTKNCDDLAWVNASGTENEALAYYLEENTCNNSAINQSYYWFGMNGLVNGNTTIVAYYNQTTPVSNADNCKLFNESAILILDGGGVDSFQRNMACKKDRMSHGNVTGDKATLHTNTGKFGRGFSMSGNSTSNPGTVGTNLTYNSTYFSEPWTLHIWIKPSSVATHALFGNADILAANIGQATGGGMRFYTSGGCDNIGAGPATLTIANVWQLYTFKKDGGRMYIYQNGTNIQNITCGAGLDFGAEAPFFIGSGGSGGLTSYDGEWDRFELWRYNWSDSEIKAHYQDVIVRSGAAEVAASANVNVTKIRDNTTGPFIMDRNTTGFIELNLNNTGNANATNYNVTITGYVPATYWAADFPTYIVNITNNTAIYYNSSMNTTVPFVISVAPVAGDCTGLSIFTDYCRVDTITDLGNGVSRHTITVRQIINVSDGYVNQKTIVIPQTIARFPNWDTREGGSGTATVNTTADNLSVSSDTLYVNVSIGTAHETGGSLTLGKYVVDVRYSYNTTSQSSSPPSPGGGGGTGQQEGASGNVSFDLTPRNVGRALQPGKSFTQEFALSCQDNSVCNIIVTLEGSQTDLSVNWAMIEINGNTYSSQNFAVQPGTQLDPGVQTFNLTVNIPVDANPQTSYKLYVKASNNAGGVIRVPVTIGGAFSISTLIGDFFENSLYTFANPLFGFTKITGGNFVVLFFGSIIAVWYFRFLFRKK